MLPNVRKLCSLKSKSNRLMSCLSLSTMCLLIMASIVIITIISITPIIILSLGEITAGQRDLILQPQAQFMNSTKIAELSNQTVLPRLEMDIQILIKRQGSESQQIEKMSGTAWFMDLNGERQAHLGTIGGDEPENHHNVYLHSAFEVGQGQQVDIQFSNPKHLLEAIEAHVESPVIDTQMAKQISKDLQALMKLNVTGRFTTKQVFSESKGKFPIGQISRFAYLDIRNAFQNMVNFTYDINSLPKQESALIAYLNSASPSIFQLGQFSSEATINVPNRIQVYSDSDYEATYDMLSSFGAQVTASIGLFSVQSSMPIASNLIIMGYFGMFIGVVLKLIILSLFILSAIMMNNMLSMGIETKQFDMALFKTIGANRAFLVFYILLDSLKYVLLSNLVAFPFAFYILRSTTDLFEDFFGYKYQIYPTFNSILGGLFIGILVPLVSSIAPMQDILSNNLTEHLNPVRNKTQAIHTEIYVEGREFPFGKLIFGLLATLFGLMIYYLLPKGLIDQDITLLLLVFFAILEGLLIGMVLIGFSFQYLLQKVVAYVFLFWVNAMDFTLMLKNLSAHRFKNRRSSILYAFSVAFIVFVSVGISIQVQTIYNQLLKKHGSLLVIQGFSVDRDYYDRLLSQTPGVQDWAYQTEELSEYLKMYHGVQKVQISDKAKLYFANNRIYGVSPNFLNTWYAPEVSLDRTDSQTPYDPYSYLYTLKGHNTTTLSHFVARKFNILYGDNQQYFINYYWKDKVARIPMNYSTIFSKQAGLRYAAFSKYTDVGVSMEKYKELAGVPYFEDIPIKYVKVRLTDPEKSAQIAQNLQRQISTKNTDTIWEYSELHATITKIQSLLTTVLNILLVVVLVISFFSLVTTSYVNILNQSLEIGILLTLGYEKSRIVKVYIYENFVLVVNSCMIGVAVGVFVAWMMSLQRELFSDFPINIEINGIPIIIVSALISSLLSTYKPLRQIFSNSVSQILNYN